MMSFVFFFYFYRTVTKIMWVGILHTNAGTVNMVSVKNKIYSLVITILLVL